MRAIIVDLDGTLCNIDHRIHHIKDRRNWDAFFAGIPQDTPYQAIQEIIWAFANQDESVAADKIKIIFVSGRPEKTRQDTKDWLYSHCSIYIDSDDTFDLRMRPDNDFRPDTIIKSEILDQLLREDYEILFALDDRPSVVAMWRSRGIFVLHVNADRWEAHHTGPQGLLTLMVGPTGAGKTSLLGSFDPDIKRRRLSRYDLGIIPSHIVSSDQLREELCGDFKDQSKNTQVFTALHNIAKARIQSGLDCVVDATNLHRRDRRAVIDACNATRVRYIVLDRPLNDKLQTAGWRNSVPGLIEKHHQRFHSALPDILSGDSNPNCEVIDLR